MSVLDYHRKILCQDVWASDELRIRPMVRDALSAQKATRFPNAKGMLLIGELVGHYYNEISDLDLLVVAKQEDVKAYIDESRFVSGHLLEGTNHKVNFNILDPTIAPAALATKFGPIYDIESGVWYGRRVTDTSEMTRAAAVLEHINWRLYKAKDSTTLNVGKWDVLTEAFVMIPEEDRKYVVHKLLVTIANLGKNIRNVIKAYNKADVWTDAARLAKVLDEGGNDDDIEQHVKAFETPEQVVAAIVNKCRYEDVLDLLEGLNEKLAKQQRINEEEGYQATRVSSVQESPLFDRLNLIINSLVASGGGHVAAVDQMVDIFASILEGNSYVATDTRKKMILKKLTAKLFPRGLVCRFKELEDEQDIDA